MPITNELATPEPDGSPAPGSLLTTATSDFPNPWSYCEDLDALRRDVECVDDGPILERIAAVFRDGLGLAGPTTATTVPYQRRTSYSYYKEAFWNGEGVYLFVGRKDGRDLLLYCGMSGGLRRLDDDWAPAREDTEDGLGSRVASIQSSMHPALRCLGAPRARTKLFPWLIETLGLDGIRIDAWRTDQGAHYVFPTLAEDLALQLYFRWCDSLPLLNGGTKSGRRYA